MHKGGQTSNMNVGINSNTNTNHLIAHTVNGQKPTALFYNSLIPGYELQERMEN